MRVLRCLARPALVLLLPLAMHDDAHAATCTRSGLASPPANTTLAADSTNTDAAVVVSTTCSERALAVDKKIPSETTLDAASLNIVRVASLPQVNKFLAAGNKISSFQAADDTGLTTLDLANNNIQSLSDGFKFPSTLTSLDLSDNLLTSTLASHFPKGLSELYLAKNGIKSLTLFDFPSGLTRLSLNGNPLTTLSGAVLPPALTTLECQTCQLTTIEGVRFQSPLTKLAISGTAPLTTIVVRKSDVVNLQNLAAGSLSAKVTACDAGATLMTTAGGLALCVMEDKAFDAKYPQRSAVNKSPSSSSTTTTAPAPANGPAATTAPGDSTSNANSATGGGDSSSTMYILVGVLVLAAVVIGAVMGFVVQRRKRKPLRPSDLRELLAEAAATTQTTTNNHHGDMSSKSVGTIVTGQSVTLGIEVTDPLPPSSSKSSGYFTNDVRNDEDLLPYRLPRDDVKLVRELAVGGFGIIYLALFFDELVVVKQTLPTKMTSNAILKRFMDEIRLYARLEHPKIARFIGLSWTTLFDLSLVMEYCANGDLHDLLKRSRAHPRGREVFTWFSPTASPRCKTLIALDIAEALVYLHSFEPVIIHRDLKSKNVLMTDKWAAKLGDFGISREADTDTMTGGMGTTAWIAPEVLQGERYSEKADIYSFGVVLSELDTCGHPYNSNRASDDSLTDPKIAVLVSTDAIKPTIEPDCPPAIRDLILSCVAFDPTLRPSAMELHFRLRTIRSDALAHGDV